MKKWLKAILTLIFVSILTITSINYIMDPMWSFEHEHPYNQYQRGSNERQQKSHHLYFSSHKYNTLLIGSSRTSYINQDLWFEKGSTFNYAVSDMQPQEYIPYIDFAITQARQPIKRIIIGLDFFGALEYHPYISTQSSSLLEPIVNNFYRWKLLLSFKALDYSIKNINYYRKKRPGTYRRNNTKNFFPTNNRTEQAYIKSNEKGLKNYQKHRYSTAYYENYKTILLTIKQNYPDIEFIVFTSPVSEEHFKLLINSGQYKNYERWLKESTKVFDKIHHFMYVNNFTKSSKDYFLDSNHPLLNTSKCMSLQIQSLPSKCKTVDLILTKDNIKDKLQILKNKNFSNDSS